MYDFKFADIGEGIHDGQILKWNVKVGDNVKDGETICIIETDKVNAEIPSPVDGVITTLGAKEGDLINVGETLVIIDDGSNKELRTEDTETQSENKDTSTGVVGSIEVSDEVIESSNEETKKHNKISKRILATPVARKLAKDLGIDIIEVIGSGENGRVLKEDIHKFNEKENVKPNKDINAPINVADENRVERVKVSKLRKTIANNMVLSKTIIPHTTVMDEINVDELVTLRKDTKTLAEAEDVKLTYMPFIIKAVVLALKEFPIFNSSFDHENDEIIYKKYFNIGIAVDTQDGLILPNIKDADKLSIFGLAKEMKVLKDQALERTLTLDQLQDGTFSITNYGVFDATFGAPVIKHPEVAIIGIGRITKKPVVKDDEIVVGHILPLSLSLDHRVIDGGDAGRFMSRIKHYLRNPMLMLLG